MEAGISAWAAVACYRVLGHEVPGEEDLAHVDIVRDAKVEGLVAWKSSKVL